MLYKIEEITALGIIVLVAITGPICMYVLIKAIFFRKNYEFFVIINPLLQLVWCGFALALAYIGNLLAHKESLGIISFNIIFTGLFGILGLIRHV